MSSDRPFEVFDLSLLAADGYLWLSVHSDQGSVHGVPRPLPASTPSPDHPTPADWLHTAIRHARADADGRAREVGELLRSLVFDVPEVAALFQQTRGVATSRAPRSCCACWLPRVPTKRGAMWQRRSGSREISSWLRIRCAF